MKQLLDTIAAEFTGCKAAVVITDLPTQGGTWKKFWLILATLDGAFTRPLLAVLAPPGQWPVTVDYFHTNPQETTTYKYEFGRDPNDVGQHKLNPPTIDNIAELERTLRGLLDLAETKLIVARMS